MKTSYKLFFFFILIILFIFCHHFKSIKLKQNSISNNSIENLTSFFNLTRKKNPILEKFKLILNPEFSLCDSKTTILAIVLVGPQFFERRDLIRKTWGNLNISQEFKILFSTALSKNETINKLVRNEFDQHKDIIQRDSIDFYHDLTNKALISFKWSSIYCKNSKFIMRINDDIVINTKSLVKYLGNNTTYLKSIFGNLYENIRVDRNPKSKFFITYDIYPFNTYYPYCEGSAYILTNDLALMIYNLSVYVNIPKFW